MTKEEIINLIVETRNKEKDMKEDCKYYGTTEDFNKYLHSWVVLDDLLEEIMKGEK